MATTLTNKNETVSEVATILLVDDREDNLLILEEILHPLRQKTVKVTSGQDALKYIFGNDVTVVIMDVKMPGMTGFETAALIREREKSRHIPIIFVTGVNAQESQQGYSLGGVDYILKPIVPDVLRAKVGVFVELFRKTEEINKQRRILQRKNDELQFEIEERRRAEEKLWELNKTLEMRVAEKTAAAQHHAEELARSNAELEQFAHIVSHDLQEPIRKIVNFSRMLQEMFPAQIDDKAKLYFNYIVDGAIRMKALIQDLLQFSQIGHPDLKMKEVDVNAMMGEIVSELEPLIAESGAKVQFAALSSIEANPTQMRQLFQNLIQNAIKFRSDRKPVIEIGVKNDVDHNVFSVQDNGIGIDEQYWDRIFNIFQRLHTRREYPGSGMGLSICKKIVERHGGKIWLKSELGKGTVFYFSIPKNRKETTDDRNWQRRRRQSEEAQASSLH